MVTETAGVEFRDIASGKMYRTVPLASDTYNILTRGGELQEGARRPCRAIILPTGGTLEVLGLDGVQVDLGDPDGAFEWPIQATQIVGGTAVNFTVVW